MKNEVNRALVAKKKLTILFAALTLCAGLWADEVIKCTATESLQDLFNNPEKFEPPMPESNNYDAETSTGTVTFPNLMEIRKDAFKDCSALISITLPASIQQIGEEAFAGCENLGSITCKASQPPFCDYRAFNDVPENIPLYVPALSVDAYKKADVWKRFDIQALSIVVGDQFKDETTGLYFEITSLDPKTVKVAKYDYSNSSSSYNIPSSVTYSDVEYTVTEIGNDAFYNCWELTSVTLPSTITTIGEYAFCACPFSSIDLPASIQRIGNKAFAGCTQLQSIIVPANVTTIEYYAFNECFALQEVTFLGNACQNAIGDNVFYGVGATTPALLTLPNNWTGTKPDEDGNWYGGKFEMSEEPIPGLTTYLDENGEEKSAVATEITSSSDPVTWTAGWYVVKGTDVQLSKGAVCSGAVHLILADGAKLTATGEENTPGIQVSGTGNSLTIYGQIDQSGQLFATGGLHAAGIGGGSSRNGQDITINGGKVTANGGENAAGIGGGNYGSGSNITINGGTVRANGKNGGSGIGGGNTGDGGGITINDGVVFASGSSKSAGIGGGNYGSGSNITINGGEVNANGGTNGAGIGGGNEGNGTDITISGGTVTATGGKGAAGIGGGYQGSGSNITAASYLIVKAGSSKDPTTEIATPRTDDTDIASSLAGKQYVKIETPVEKITLTAADFTVTKDGDWKYDQTEKRVNVELKPEYIMPSADKITIYYNNDKMVKPIDPGTYQVYIDIEETDTYAAVTGITSEEWKFDIIDPKGAIQAIDDKKEEAMQAINSEAGDFETVPIVQEVVEGAKVKLEDVTITATNTINEATDQSTITTTKDDAISKIDEIEASAKTDIQTAIANFKESVKNEIDNAATDTKSKIDAFAVSDKVKYDAKSEINKAVAVAKETIDNANFQEQINNAKNSALNEINKQLAIVEDSYAQLQDAKVVAIQKIEEVAADAEAAIDEAAGEYASLQAIWEIISSKKEEIVSKKGEASHFIGDATDMEEILLQKEEAIQRIKDIKSEAVEKIQEAIADYKQKTIVEIKDVASTAKEEIDGLGVDESAKSEAKAEIDNIANMAEQTINAATSKDAIDNAKTQAIADIHNVVQTTKDMWVTVRTDGAAGNWNTICLERNITAIDGATFWNVVSETDAAFTLEQVEAPFPAGVGYIIRYTATELKVKYGSEVAQTPVTATQDHPIQGNFAEITCDQYGQNELVDNYVVYQNQLCKVTGGWVTMADHRAYVVAGLALDPSKAPAPNGAPRMTMPKPNSTPTDNSSLHHSINSHTRGASFKMIKDGQFVIIRDNKMYTIMGVEE